MQTSFEIADADLALVEQLGAVNHLSRDEVITQAIREYAVPRRFPMKGDGFGIWKDMQEDALAYEDRLRAEW